MSKVSKKKKKGKTGAVTKTAVICGITGDPDLDEIIDKMSVLGNNPVAESFLGLMQLMPRPPVAEA